VSDSIVLANNQNIDVSDSIVLANNQNIDVSDSIVLTNNQNIDVSDSIVLANNQNIDVNDSFAVKYLIHVPKPPETPVFEPQLFNSKENLDFAEDLF
jgi:hypothetical protein